jgi:hypothetical protein
MPVGTTAQQATNIVVQYIDGQPARIHEDFNGFAVEALRANWPCSLEAAPRVAPISSSVAASDAQAPNAELAALSALKTYVEGTARNANNEFARLTDRLDRIERAQAEPNAKLARIAEAVDRLEKERKSVMAAAAAPTAAAPETTGTVPNSRPAPAEAKILPNWILHGVRGKRALVENSHGDLFEITGDSTLPGLGRVEGIKRQDGQWVVVTARGLITSAP